MCTYIYIDVTRAFSTYVISYLINNITNNIV
jgi:hypothetical protein